MALRGWAHAGAWRNQDFEDVGELVELEVDEESDPLEEDCPSFELSFAPSDFPLPVIPLCA